MSDKKHVEENILDILSIIYDVGYDLKDKALKILFRNLSLLYDIGETLFYNTDDLFKEDSDIFSDYDLNDNKIKNVLNGLSKHKLLNNVVIPNKVNKKRKI